MTDISNKINDKDWYVNMCKTKAEGGRCNGWYAKELAKLDERWDDSFSKNPSKNYTPEDRQAIINKIKKIQQEIKEKPMVNIPENMTIADLKREHKKLAKIAQFYKKHDKEKYVQFISTLGAQIRNHVIESPLSKDLDEKLAKTKLPPDGIAILYQGATGKDFGVKGTPSFIENLAKYRSPELLLTQSNVQDFFNEEEIKQLLNYSRNNDFTEKNLKNIQNLLNNDLKIKTGNPKNILTKATNEQREFYNTIDKIIPSHFFIEKSMPETVAFDKTTSKREYMKPTIKRNKDNLTVATLESSLTRTMSFKHLFNIQDSDSDEIIKEKFENSLDNQAFEGHLGKAPIVIVQDVIRDENGKIKSFNYYTATYKVNKRKPIDKNNIKWEKVNNTPLEYGNLYRGTRMHSDEIKKEIEYSIRLRPDSPMNTKVHETIHTYQAVCPNITNTEGIIHYQRTKNITGEYKDNGEFFKGAFKDDYMSKTYHQAGANYEIYPMAVPLLLSGDSDFEKEVQDSFLGMLVTD